MARRILSARDRWAVCSRVLAASAGGYAFTWLATAALALLLRDGWAVARADAVLTAAMTGFVVYTVVIIAVFHARSATRAWVGLLVGSVFPAVVVVLLR